MDEGDRASEGASLGPNLCDLRVEFSGKPWQTTFSRSEASHVRGWKTGPGEEEVDVEPDRVNPVEKGQDVKEVTSEETL